MKILLIAIVIALSAITAAAQSTLEVQYTYDAAGNRIHRKMVVVTLKSAELSNEEEPLPAMDAMGELKVIVYPNPTKGNLRISIEGGEPAAAYNYLLYNSSGGLLSNGQINGQGETPIEMGQYKVGFYFLVVTGCDKKLTFKIIKE